LRANGGWWFGGEREVVGGRMAAGGSRVRASGHLGRDGGRWFEGEGAVIGGEWRLVGRK